MIYLLQDCYKNENNEVIDILKIGFSNKSFKESRENHYKTHNYGFRFLMEREGDIELERYLHKKFSKYLLPDSFEWFYYNEIIINSFNTIQECIMSKDEYVSNVKSYLLKSLESPESLYKTNKENIFTELQKDIEYNKKDKNIYYRRIKGSFELGYDLIKKSIENTCNSFNSIFNDVPNEITKDWYNENSCSSRAKLFYDSCLKKIFENNYDKYIKDKVENTENLICAYNKVDPSIRRTLIEHYKRIERLCDYDINYVKVINCSSCLVPSFYELIMNTEIRSFKVQQESFEKKLFNFLFENKNNEVINISQDIDIGKEIQNEFKVGEVCSRSDIKERLKKIYDRTGYKETPKAVDIGNYFYIKDKRITNKETGKRDKGYEIIERKNI